MKNKAWHFTDNKLRDGQPLPETGEWLEHDGPVKICDSGLHFSREPFDALQYAPGNHLHMVEVEDIVEEQDDKGVCRKRKIIASMDATEMLRYYSRMQALSVVHLWDAPDIVFDYLMTGDEDLRTTARAAAWATRATARAAAWAAWAAPAAAARATWDARDAGAAAGATWDAGAAAGTAVRGAAASAAARATWDAWDARDESRKEFNELVCECFEEVL